MQTPNTPSDVRRVLLRGLATGLLFSQSALMLFAQAAAPAAGTTTDQPASDQTPKKDEVVVLEAYTVNGSFAGSLAAAAAAKENSQAIVEVIASEDIGKLPDVSIADSLTRLTGVAAQRTNGRAQTIAIRGLNSDFTVTMLNGREQVSTGSGRGVEFDQYPAELLSQVVVYKTAGANLTSQGIGGSVDLITVQPLSKTGRTVALNAYYATTQYNLLAPGVKKDGNRFSAAYIDQFADGKFGIALGYSHTLSPFEGKQFQAWGYNGEPGGSGAQMMTGTKSYVRSSNLTRDGYMGVFEAKPSDEIHSTVDIYYSKFEEKQELRGWESGFYPGWVPSTLEPGYTISNGEVTQFTLDHIHPVIRAGDSFIRNDTLVAAGWNLKLFEKSAWPITFDAGYSRITRHDRNLELWTGLSFNNAGPGDTLTVKTTPGGMPVITKTLDYANPANLYVTDAAGWQSSPNITARPGYYKEFNSKDELGQVKAFTKHELGAFFKDVEIGAAYTDRYKRDGEGPSDFITFPTGQTQAAFPAKIGTTDLSFLGIMGGIAAFDSFAYMDSGAVLHQPNTDTGIIALRWNVEEKITRPYVQFDIDSKIGTVPVTGNLGFQLNHVDQASHGLSAQGQTTLVPVNAGAKYNDIAPSLNLNFRVADDTFIRFSAARQIARPRMFDMRASRTYSYNNNNANSTDPANSPWSGDGGNPGLKPWKSDSIDLAFDKYFKDNTGYVSLAFFNKKLLNYIYEAQTVQSFAGYTIPTGAQTPAETEGVTTTPFNGQGGNIKGAELTISLSSELLTNKAVKGFGVILGGAYTDSSVEPWGPGHGTSPINNLSRKVANATLYYERHGFSIRVSEHYRSDYRAYITTFGAPSPKGDVNPNGGFATTQPERQVDAQASYSIQSGALKDLTFYIQAYNMNDSPLITFNNGNPNEVVNYQKYGASYSAGVSYKF